MNRRAGIYRAQNICRFAATKGSTQQRRVSTQRRRDLRCYVPESGQRATQRYRLLRLCRPERYTAKMNVATQRRRVLRCCISESLEQGFSILF